MDTVISIILFFLIFGIVVFVHEFGHFIIARQSGIKVNEFCLGMGPALVSFTRGGTRYAIRLLPLGGACMFEGEDGKYTTPDEDGEKAKESDPVADTKLEKQALAFPQAPVFARIATVFAGPFFNFILAFLFSMIIIGSYGADMPVIQKVVDGGGAQTAGLKEGDRILKLGKQKIRLYREISMYSMLSRGESIEVTYERDGKESTCVVTPQYSEKDGRFYLGLLGVGEYRRFGLGGTVKYSFFEVRYWINSVIKSLELIFRGKVSKDDVAGPVGMAKMVGDVYTQSKPDGLFYVWLNMLNFCVLLSANLGVMNLLPIPALDGGRLVFLLLEVVRGKPIPPEKEGFVHMVGMVCLMALMVFIFYNDITRLF